jgi:CRP/FNR family cyclic AMP-dependent transcriptional regulator
MDVKTLEPILTEHPFFAGLKPEYISLLVGCASNMRFDANQMIVRHGDEARYFFMLRHGSVAIEVHDPRHHHITIETLSDGDVFGWSWLFPPYHAHFDVRALSLVRVIALDGECIRKKFEADHDLGYEMMKRFMPVIVERLKHTSMQLLDVYR